MSLLLFVPTKVLRTRIRVIYRGYKLMPTLVGVSIVHAIFFVTALHLCYLDSVSIFNIWIGYYILHGYLTIHYFSFDNLIIIIFYGNLITYIFAW